MDVVGVDVDLAEQPLVEAAYGALRVLAHVAQPELAHVEGDNVGKGHLVGKVQLHQLVVHVERSPAGTQPYHASPLLAHVAGYLAGNVGSHVGRSLAGSFHYLGIDFLAARERGQLQLALGPVQAGRHLVELYL